MARTFSGGGRMTDDEFLELVSEELKTCITKDEISTYRKGIPVIAEKLKEQSNFEILKKICIDNIECSDCKKLGVFDLCKSSDCEKIRTEIVEEYFPGV
jgi:hypothetical protein